MCIDQEFVSFSEPFLSSVLPAFGTASIATGVIAVEQRFA
jgi:hypothetical protein